MGAAVRVLIYMGTRPAEPVVLETDGRIRPEASPIGSCASNSFPLKPLSPILPQDQYVRKLLSFQSLFATNTAPKWVVPGTAFHVGGPVAALGDLVAESNAVAFPWGGTVSGAGSPVTPQVTHLAVGCTAVRRGAGLQRSRSHFGADGAGRADSLDTRHRRQ